MRGKNIVLTPPPPPPLIFQMDLELNEFPKNYDMFLSGRHKSIEISSLHRSHKSPVCQQSGSSELWKNLPTTSRIVYCLANNKANVGAKFWPPKCNKQITPVK